MGGGGHWNTGDMKPRFESCTFKFAEEKKEEKKGEVLPLRKGGGAGKVLAMLKRGQKVLG